MLTEIPEVKYIHDTRSRNSGNIHGENLHILAIEREKSFLENWNIFSQKTAPQLLGHIELQNMKVGVKRVLSYAHSWLDCGKTLTHFGVWFFVMTFCKYILSETMFSTQLNDAHFIVLASFDSREEKTGQSIYCYAACSCVF